MVLGVATDCRLSLNTVCLQIPAGACEEVASDLRVGGGFMLGTPVSSAN